MNRHPIRIFQTVPAQLMAFLRHLRPPPLSLRSSRARTQWTSCFVRLSRTFTSYPPQSPSKTNQKPFYITTPIFYPNASPHIGHLYSLVTGDVFARYQRLRGRNVEYLTGTDEHGMKIQRAARMHFGEGGREREFCDSLSERFRDLGRRANISNTCFMRTSSEEHHRAVKHVWCDLYAKGYIYKSRYSGWYSITDECFYTDAQVSTSPPPPAGDGHTVSLETGSTVEWTSEENYMFRLSAFRDALLEHYTKNERSVYPPQYHENVLAMLGAAPLAEPERAEDSEAASSKVALVENFSLSDISISRPRSRLEWGVPVPNDPEQTVYVWFDALLIYLTGAGYPWSSSSSSSTGAWPADIQVIGKDILRFHAIYLPAIILALSGGPYQSSPSSPTSSTPAGSLEPSPSFSTSATSRRPIPLARTLLTHAHWTSSQKKMSKSLGNVADPLEAMDKYGVDVVRFYMMRVGGRWRGDVDWSEEQLSKHHKEIQAQLGNYFLRIASPRIAQRARDFATSSFTGELDVDSGLPAQLRALFVGRAAAGLEEDGPGKVVFDPNYELLQLVLGLPERYTQCMDELEAGQALGEIMNVLKVANKTLTDIAPWSSSTDPHLVHTTRIVALETLRVVGVLLGPFMPDTSQRLLQALGEDEQGGEEVLSVKAGDEEWGRREMEKMWARWALNGVKGVKLF